MNIARVTLTLVWLFIGPALGGADSTSFFSYDLKGAIAGQYVYQACDRDSAGDWNLPTSLRYDEGEPLFRLNATFKVGKHLFAEQDVQFKVREDSFLQRPSVHNVVDDLNSS
jgi:hypothetical protein